MDEYHWKDLLPMDGYVVKLKGLLHSYDRKVITGLYQPLIGSLAMSLYFTLWNEVSNENPIGIEMTHHSLLTSMQISLKDIYKERQKLEAIGLLNVYVKDENETRIYVYELQPPLPPAKFFEDSLLNIFLYGRVGARKYMAIRNAFSYEEMDLNGYKNVTCSFDDVFQAFSPVQLAAFEEYGEALANDKQAINRYEAKEISLGQTSFDFQLYEKEIEHFLLPRRVITDNVREVVVKLAFLYGLNPLEMATVTIDARESDESINIEKLRKYAREKYQFNHEGTLPVFKENVQPTELKVIKNNQPKTPLEEQMEIMERLSPIDYFSSKMNGALPSQSDIKIIEGIMVNQQLPPAVVNALIDYVLFKCDMKLAKGYAEKIASHWARKKVKTVKEAMDLAKQEEKNYQEWTKNKNQPKQTKKAIRKETLPDWAIKKKQDEAKKTETKPIIDKEQARRELEAMLKQFKKE
ncbi:MAG: replication initiation and membrane attachment family protein [Bacillaceae bacterium]